MTGAGAARAQAARAPMEPGFASRSQQQASNRNYNGRGAASESSRLPLGQWATAEALPKLLCTVRWHWAGLACQRQVSRGRATLAARHWRCGPG
jgi:hypothetical protein